MVLGFAPDTSQLVRLVSLHGGRLLEDRLPARGVILNLQSYNGSDSLYSIEFNSDSNMRSFLEEARKYFHLKAVLELGGEELPFYVLCRAKKYKGSAFYDPSTDSERA
ncbi:MAG: hypothetical protein NZ992_00395 [Candidatus Korarchaeum sp.]|nr:hypothetical protein [Candidatus Korarchaeum sp.]MDW8035048.1 hypothetical protein [Candidatus Korarchaeum sp.]